MKKEIFFTAIIVIALLGNFPSIAQQQLDAKKERVFWYPAKITPSVKTHLELNLFPNPARELVEVKLSTNDKNEGFLQVYDSKGTSILSKTWTGEKLDVSAFQPGVYIVTLRKNKLVYSQKLVVARE